MYGCSVGPFARTCCAGPARPAEGACGARLPSMRGRGSRGSGPGEGRVDTWCVKCGSSGVWAVCARYRTGATDCERCERARRSVEGERDTQAERRDSQEAGGQQGGSGKCYDSTVLPATGLNPEIESDSTLQQAVHGSEDAARGGEAEWRLHELEGGEATPGAERCARVAGKRVRGRAHGLSRRGRAACKDAQAASALMPCGHPRGCGDRARPRDQTLLAAPLPCPSDDLAIIDTLRRSRGVSRASFPLEPDTEGDGASGGSAARDTR